MAEISIQTNTRNTQEPEDERLREIQTRRKDAVVRMCWCGKKMEKVLGAKEVGKFWSGARGEESQLGLVGDGLSQSVSQFVLSTISPQHHR